MEIRWFFIRLLLFINMAMVRILIEICRVVRVRADYIYDHCYEAKPPMFNKYNIARAGVKICL